MNKDNLFCTFWKAKRGGAYCWKKNSHLSPATLMNEKGPQPVVKYSVEKTPAGSPTVGRPPTLGHNKVLSHEEVEFLKQPRRHSMP